MTFSSIISSRSICLISTASSNSSFNTSHISRCFYSSSTNIYNCKTKHKA